MTAIDTPNESMVTSVENLETPVSTSFSDLLSENTKLAEALAGLGFQTPTPVQAQTIPLALKGRDLIIQAKTGSGKTFAFAIPLLTHLAKSSKDQTERGCPLALVVAPTRELAHQVTQVVQTLASEFSPVEVIGGVDMNQQLKELEADSRIVVGTPGRILDMMRQRHIKLHNCRYFVLDEADEMLSMGFIEDVRAILSRLPDKRQGLFVSATITPRVEMLANSFLTRPEQICTGTLDTDAPSIEHLYCEIGGELMAKPAALCDLIETLRPRSAIIFCNTKSDTSLVEVLLRRRGFDARRINSDLTQSQRDRVMKKIRSQELQFLVATDIAARGIDIEQIDLVVNYSIHEQPETYVHRTGRTGRAGRSGKAISLIGPRDIGAFHFLKKVVDVSFEKLTLPTEEEITGARLSHLYEMVRKKEMDISARDLLVSAGMLKELGEIENAPTELVQFVAKLCRFSLEHFISSEAKSLEDELSAQEKDSAEDDSQAERGNDRRRQSRDKDERGGNRRDRDSRRDRDPRDRDSRREADGDSRRNREPRRETNRDQKPSHARDVNNEERSNTREREPRRQERRDEPAERQAPREFRFYVGQGRAHGMNEEIFSGLAENLAEVPRSAMQTLSFREHYGFVDIIEPHAERVVRLLNGIEYNGTQLPVELAASPSGQQGGRRGGRRDGRENRAPRRDEFSE